MITVPGQMAPAPLPTRVRFDIAQNEADTSPNRASHAKSRSPHHRRTGLQELYVDNLQNIQGTRAAKRGPGAPSDPARNNPLSATGTTSQPICRHPSLARNTFESPGKALEDDDRGVLPGVYVGHELGEGQQPPLSEPRAFPVVNTDTAASELRLEDALTHIPSDRDQLHKNQSGQFEWVLSVPKAEGSVEACTAHLSSQSSASEPVEEGRLYFGCNLIQRRPQPIGPDGSSLEAADTYTLIATRIAGDVTDIAPPTESLVGQLEVTMASAAGLGSEAVGSGSPSLFARRSTPARRESPIVIASDRETDLYDQAGPRSPSKPGARIEDSVEALDMLEEQLEALNEVSAMDRLLPSGTAGVQRSKSTSRAPGGLSRPADERQAPATLGRSASVRRQTIAPTLPSQDRVRSVDDAARRRSLAPRPTSLMPPKPPARSTKTPTVPQFELPGEAVARRLKEKKEARMSLLISAEQAAAAAAAAARPRTPRQPTIPTFELPGEAISRRKRAEHEAKVKAQEEEERRRRQFKAKPIRNSFAPNSYPRETATSRARQSKGPQMENAFSDGGMTPMAVKRQSLAAQSPVRMPLSTAAGSSNVGAASAQLQRGRGSVSTSSAAHLSRANSTSTGSINGSGKRSTVSAEDAEVQKVRGRHIYSRDNSVTADRVKTQREREAAAKAARQEAAERSRQLSREWAEKQRMKGMKMAAATAVGSAAQAQAPSSPAATAKAF